MTPFIPDPPAYILRTGERVIPKTIAERETLGEACETCGAWCQRIEVWDEETQRYRPQGVGPWAMGRDWVLCAECRAKEYQLRQRDRRRYVGAWEYLRRALV